MKTLIRSFFVAALLCLSITTELHAQGNVFTFQGRLNDTNDPLNTNVAMVVRIYAVSSGGAGLWQETQSSVPVTNGLFSIALGQSVPVDASILNGSARWLGISVNGSAELTPRIQITAAPYAITAGNLTGVVPASGLSGTYSSAVTFNNPGNAFNGNGVGLTSLNASQLTTGTVPDAALGNAWKVGGNAGTTPGTQFLGTTDNQPLELRVNGLRALRLEFGGDSNDTGSTPDGAPNVIGGSPINRVVSGAVGATIGGGGATNFEGVAYLISVGGNFGTIGGGRANIIHSNAVSATIAGGEYNAIQTNSEAATVGGGYFNTIDRNAFAATIAGGYGNEIGVDADISTISGGQENRLGNNADYSVISGGLSNTLDTAYSAIGGGIENDIAATSDRSFLGGGWRNSIQGASDQSAVVGGNRNTILSGARESFIGGGFANAIATGGVVAFVGGGVHNTNAGLASFIGGGDSNDIGADSDYSAIGGGSTNVIGTNSAYGSIGGGQSNSIAANSLYATIPGGVNNTATNYAFAAGRRAKANHTGSFVWGDSQNADFVSSSTNQFLIRAQGGVGIGTATPGNPFAVEGIGTTNGGVVGFPEVMARFRRTGASHTALSIDAETGRDAVLYLAENGATKWGLRHDADQNHELDIRYSITPATSIEALKLSTNGDLIVAGTINGTIANNAIASAQIVDSSVTAADVNAPSFSTTFWKADGNVGTTAGTQFLGTTDNEPLELKVNSLRALRLEPGVSGFPNVIGGAANNQVAAAAFAATIAGGQQNAIGSQGDASTVGGGWMNTVATGANSSTVAGGIRNTAGGTNTPGITVASTVGGGESNFADAPYATIGGGLFNTNTGLGATIPGGRENVASGSTSFAAGRRAKANHTGAFVWGDSQNADFASTGTNQFLIRAQGGVGINITNPLHRLHVGLTRGTNAFNASTNVIAIEDAEEDGRATFLALAGIGGSDTTNRVELQMEAVESSRRGIIGTTTEHPLYLRVGNSDVMLLATNRFVGIGETDPQARLHVTSSGSASPQLHLEQTVNNDFARVRLTSAPKPSWDIAVGGAANVMNFFNPTNGNVMTLTTNGNLTTIGTVNGVSDRAAKTRFTPVNNREILERVAELPLARWRYKTDPGVPHLGPVAQDFHAAFGLGTDDKHIATVDADGVALAAIQGLNQKFEERLKEKDAELESLKQQLAELQELITTRIAKGNDL